LKEALAWLRNGHALAVFPAGEVSHLSLSEGQIRDAQWNPMIARLAQKTNANTLPVFFRGGNSLAFHVLGLVHPDLRTAWLMNEFLNQKGKTLEVRIGTTIPSNSIAAMAEDEAIDYLRRRTYLLSRRPHKSISLQPLGTFPFPPKKKDQAIADACEQRLLSREIQTLNGSHLVEDTREFSVYVARAAEIPNLLREIGRLCEITFRVAGEGSGRSLDLDRFDDYYLHLFLWDKQKECVAGAYRMGICPEILASQGPSGLYTSTLFHYQPEFFEKLGLAMELGRSFVIPQYQRKFASLLLFWKGIGGYIERHPETPVVFGAVSISRLYNSASRELMVKYFESRQRAEISQFVRPRRPFRPAPFQPWDCASTSRVLRDVEDLGDSVSDLEVDAKGIPVLVRQYVKLGGTLLAFNVDRNFSDVLDGLVFLDLRRSDSAALQRYMGKKGLEEFRRYHAAESVTQVAVVNSNGTEASVCV
jgi:putative hemolysin